MGATTALAFDISPEYQGITERDHSKFEAPSEINSEYQIIWNAYQAPLSWAQAWERNKREFNFSSGSLSNDYFVQNSQAKFETEWTDNLSFHFVYLNQRDLEVDQSRHIIELRQKITPTIKIAVYGEPSHFKRENDAGGALIYSPRPEQEHRFYYTAHDFTRNSHNNETDKFKKNREPASVGYHSVQAFEKLWARFGFRHDLETQWLRPQEQRVFEYEKSLVYGDFEWRLENRRRFELRAQWDDTYEEQTPNTAASTVTLKAWRLQRNWLRAVYAWAADDGSVSYEASTTFLHRNWKNEANHELDHYNFLPGFTSYWRATKRGEKFDRIQVGYEFGFYDKDDPYRLTAATQKNKSLEMRLQTGYEFALKNDATFLFTANFDTDDWNTVPSFEGGSGHFRSEF